LKSQPFTKAPGTSCGFTTVPLLRSKHPRQNGRKAIRSLGHGGGGAGQNPVAPAAVSAGERWGGRLGTHPRSVCGLRWGRGTVGEGAQRHSWAAAAGSSAPAWRRSAGRVSESASSSRCQKRWGRLSWAMRWAGPGAHRGCL
jgi:hypothetical protein